MPNFLNQRDNNITPRKMLDLISPVLNSNENFSNVKKRGQALAKVLTRRQKNTPCKRSEEKIKISLTL